jgi:hypothetical protein
MASSFLELLHSACNGGLRLLRIVMGDTSSNDRSMTMLPSARQTANT